MSKNYVRSRGGASPENALPARLVSMRGAKKSSPALNFVWREFVIRYESLPLAYRPIFVGSLIKLLSAAKDGIHLDDSIKRGLPKRIDPSTDFRWPYQDFGPIDDLAGALKDLFRSGVTDVFNPIWIAIAIGAIVGAFTIAGVIRHWNDNNEEEEEGGDPTPSDPYPTPPLVVSSLIDEFIDLLLQV